MTIVSRMMAAAFVAAFAISTIPTAQAFMAGPTETENAVSSTELTATVDQLRQEMKAGETSCESMLGKIDAAIVRVDAALELGVADETKTLAIRDELVEMRLSLPCLAQDFAAVGDIAEDGSTVIAETPMGEAFASGTDGEFGTVGGFGGGFAGGSTGGAGGLGGAGAGGGGGLGIGGLAALGAAIAIPIAVSDENDPGVSPSRR